MRILVILISAGLMAFTAFIGGWVLAGHQEAERIDHVVAMSWGDGRYGKAFYGAHVYLISSGQEYEVHARVLLGRGNDYFHDLGLLGRVATPEDAVTQFGKIEWRPDGLHIGDGQNFPVFLERARLESHR
jgi:hypothetical protein